ncbi:hypothetical protein BASA50_003795 [Batrachochytrium salamandrivorans]|uniref:Exonuclease 1 n=1 Tax=Batrachochytrium salamandrivorans TaxID=1357716 RepID=A0ABQ8FHG2_9FUNG|nr:hypothetical protein BASA50_003795 [Batrachochytrium salamandrivorans]
MGISGLLPLLKTIHRTVHLSEYSGQAIGVDAYVWLHKGAFACAFDLCQDIPTTRYVDYCMNKIRQLQSHNIWPVIVFDGDRLPMKMRTEDDRHKRREETRAKGVELLRNGNRDKAQECFQMCVDVTPQMAHELIKKLRENNIEYIVAPYEADAQLTYLNQLGDISAIITEDSDLLVFGCTHVIFKLDHQGNGTAIRHQDISTIKEMRGWSASKIRHMCILSGCDYLESPVGIGIKKALALLGKSEVTTLIKTWKAWGKAANSPKLPPDYYRRFMLADFVFQHQRVYDPLQGVLVPLTPFASDLVLSAELSLLIGPDLPKQLAVAIAIGDTDPISKTPFTLPIGDSLKMNRQRSTPQIPPILLHPSNPSLAEENYWPGHDENSNPNDSGLPRTPATSIQVAIHKPKNIVVVSDTTNCTPLAVKSRVIPSALLDRFAGASCTMPLSQNPSNSWEFLDQNLRGKSHISTTPNKSTPEKHLADVGLGLDGVGQLASRDSTGRSERCNVSRVLHLPSASSASRHRVAAGLPRQSTGAVSKYFAVGGSQKTVEADTRLLKSHGMLHQPTVTPGRLSLLRHTGSMTHLGGHTAVLDVEDRSTAAPKSVSLPCVIPKGIVASVPVRLPAKSGSVDRLPLDASVSLESVFGYRPSPTTKRRLGTGRISSSMSTAPGTPSTLKSLR